MITLTEVIYDLVLYNIQTLQETEKMKSYKGNMLRHTHARTQTIGYV